MNPHCPRLGPLPVRTALALAAAFTLAPSLCLAQGMPNALPGNPLGPVGMDHSGGKPANGGPQRPPPAALPGAQSNEAVAPATQSAADMAPNDALFDAINRGDITAARDALSRGAELGAHNILGMTPLELSVDLGRNDISFLLLSMRGEPGSSPAGQAPAADKQVASAPPAARPKVRAVAQPAPRAVRPVAANRPAPRQYANDGGTPIPAAGFLGFGGGASSDR